MGDESFELWSVAVLFRGGIVFILLLVMVVVIAWWVYLRERPFVRLHRNLLRLH